MMIKQMIRSNNALLLLIVLSAFSIGMGSYGIAHAQTNTTVLITQPGGVTFQNTAWVPQSYTVDTSSIMNDQYIYVQVLGSSTNDPYVRSLVIDINGQIVHRQTLPYTRIFFYGIGPYYTDEVQNSFFVRYDVTSAVANHPTSTVQIGLSTTTGSWNVQAEFVAVTNNNGITIPIGGSGSGSTSSSTSSSSTSTSTSSSGSSSSGGSTNSGLFIPYSELLFGIAVLALAGAFISKGHSERA